MYNREDAFTADPFLVLALDASIVEDGSFVHSHTPAMDLAGKGNLLRVEVIEAWSIDNIIWVVTQDVNDRIRGI